MMSLPVVVGVEQDEQRVTQLLLGPARVIAGRALHAARHRADDAQDVVVEVADERRVQRTARAEALALAAGDGRRVMPGAA